MPITSMIVKCREEKASSVAWTIAALPGATVSNVEGDQLVVITETTTREQDQGLWDRIEALPEVVALTVVYHNFEDLTPQDDGEETCHAHGNEPA